MEKKIRILHTHFIGISTLWGCLCVVDETRIPKAVQVSAAHRGVVHAHELLSHRSYTAGTGQAGEPMEKEL